MENTSLFSKSTYNTVTDVPHEISIAAKLRRLKIEENIYLQSLHKLDKDLNDTSDSNFIEYGIFFTKTKNSFNEIKKTFQDVKTSVSSQEMLKSVEIDEIRGNILELENNIKSFKTSLEIELTGLKSSARQLNVDLCEVPVKIDKMVRSTKRHIAKYNEIVPSPVKIMMNSPFKSEEVQEFQDFMKSSLNRYGGWNEYNHNIFVNSWQKLFYPENNSGWEECDPFHESSPTFQAFLEEVLPKLQGITIKDVISHAQWYSKYVTLKERQQNAIDKWRTNRERMKKSTKVIQNLKKNVVTHGSGGSQKCNTRRSLKNNKMLYTELDDVKNLVPSFNYNHPRYFVRKCLSEESMQDKASSKDLSSYDESVESVEILHFLRPTKQWNIRCNNKIKEPHKYTNGVQSSVEYIKKLGMPTWRKGFQKY